MKTPLFSHALWALAVATAFVVGYFAGDAPIAQNAATFPATSPKAAPPGIGSDAASRARPDENLAPNAPARGTLTGDEARARTFQILAEPNRIARMRQLCDLLAHITRDNWREVKSAFSIQTREEGRWQPNEWRLMIERVGEVAGAEALAEAMEAANPSDQNRARDILIGFAAGDPKAAVEWFQAQPAGTQQQFFNQLLSGLGRSDPSRALALLNDQPHPLWETNVPAIIDGAIQLGGFRAVEDLYASIRDRADVPSPGKGMIFYEMARRQVTIATDRKDPTRTLDWFDRYLAVTGPGATKEIIACAAKADASKTLVWLEGRADRMPSDQLPAAYATVAKMSQAQGPEQFAAWMNVHPLHPQHDTMAQAVATSFLQNGRIAEARKWTETIRDPQARANLDQAVQHAEATVPGTERNSPK